METNKRSLMNMAVIYVIELRVCLNVAVLWQKYKKIFIKKFSGKSKICFFDEASKCTELI